MPDNSSYIFASYARVDVEAVMPIVQAIQKEYDARNLNVRVWFDLDQLRPGQQWKDEIEQVLLKCIGLLVFVSPNATRSDWVRRELEVSLQSGRLVIPIILSRWEDLPLGLRNIQGVDLSGARSKKEISEAAREIVEATERVIKSEIIRPAVPALEAPGIAAKIAEETRSGPKAGISEPEVPHSVFVVHGHHPASLNEVENYLTTIGIKSIVLSRIEGPAQSLFQKFLSFSTSAKFAIVILSADDLGASLIQYYEPGVADRSLQFRARQNVILELGFFYGFLGWENVFVLFRTPEKVFPNFERPSDIEGVVFDAIDADGKWQKSLTEKLAAAGFDI